MKPFWALYYEELHFQIISLYENQTLSNFFEITFYLSFCNCARFLQFTNLSLLFSQEKNVAKQSISVARCYPMKNRFPDILPYDTTRVELPSTKDDYINASFIQNISSLCPPAILTQAPLPATYSDFWTMIWEQQVELIVCLQTDSEVILIFTFIEPWILNFQLHLKLKIISMHLNQSL